MMSLQIPTRFDEIWRVHKIFLSEWESTLTSHLVLCTFVVARKILNPLSRQVLDDH